MVDQVTCKSKVKILAFCKLSDTHLSMTASAGNQLAAPGAGLPRIELAIARSMFSWKCRMGTRNGFIARFIQERSAIQALVESCQESERGKRILIARLRGLEDSSRNWSVWMTLDHLRITNEAFAHVVTELAEGRIPEGEASTAAVKPTAQPTSAVEADYERSCDGVLAAVAAAPQLKTANRFSHPWFGPLDAFAWLALSSLHLGIHRAQIAAILKGLGQ